MKWLIYTLFRMVIGLLSGLSDKTLYKISTLLKYVLLKVFKYRLDVVQTNLERSFPTKTKVEVRHLIDQYYQNLSEILIESLASYGWPNSRFESHFKFKNLDILHGILNIHPRVIGVTAHTGNFELGAVLTQNHLGVPCYAVYRPLANPYIEEFLLKKRTKQGLTIRPNKQLGELIERMTGKSILFLVADQNPASIAKAFWVDFLHQDTAFVHGPAVLAKTHNMPVLYFDTVRIRQGYYECSISVLIADPAKYSELDITHAYAKKLEAGILKNPDDWLWSHKRWKWKRAEGEVIKI
jgi:KDO2-lipid IV(A) lauroyltransferase